MPNHLGNLGHLFGEMNKDADRAKAWAEKQELLGDAIGVVALFVIVWACLFIGHAMGLQ